MVLLKMEQNIKYNLQAKIAVMKMFIKLTLNTLISNCEPTN